MLVGAEVFDGHKRVDFSIETLVGLVNSTLGPMGVYIFAMGFVAAALSSMLTVPLGAIMAAKGVFGDEDHQDTSSEAGAPAAPKLPRGIYFGSTVLMVTVAVAVVGSNAPRVTIILVAQVCACALP